MIINVRNWGAVGQVSIDTDKPLILMCGPNSTGKTYVSYLLYTLFSKLVRSGDYMNASIPVDVMEQIRNGGMFTINEQLIRNILDQTAVSIKKDLIPTIFAISEDVRKTLFRYFKLEIGFSKGQFDRIIASKEERTWIYIGRLSIRFVKEANSPSINVIISQKEDDDPRQIPDLTPDNIPDFEKMLFSFLMSLTLGSTRDARMLTVERNSVYTFSKELGLSRFNDSFTMQRYPLAVTDSLIIANDLQQLQKSKGEYFDYASRLEENLLKGNIEIDQNGAVEFVPSTKAKTRHHLPIQMTSSIVKTMSSLILYLKHLARKNDLVIIDEPEMNLHPDNQILLTRIFAELVNKGLRIVISTHSDYVIREFNNMIMAKEIINRKISMDDGEELPYQKSQMLSIKDTEVLYFNISRSTGKVIGQSVPVTEFGFDIESIDETIRQQNSNTHLLANLLKYGEPKV